MFDLTFRQYSSQARPYFLQVEIRLAVSLNRTSCRNFLPLILVVSLDTSDQQHEGGHGGQVVGGQEGGAQGQGCNT